MPASNPIGSTIYAWAQNINGDSDYQELRIESSDPSVISTPGIISDKTYVNPLNVLAAGITQITVYPTYNPAIKKTYTLRIGENGSVDIAQAEITLSEKSYIYTGRVIGWIHKMCIRDSIAAMRIILFPFAGKLV